MRLPPAERTFRPCLTVLVLGLAAVLRGQTYPTPNLWPNGDAESGPISGLPGPVISGIASTWTRAVYGPTVPTSVGARLGGGTYVTEIGRYRPVGQSLVATLGLTGLNSIDLSPYQAEIDLGQLQLRVSAWFGGPETGNLWEVFQGEFLDASAASLFAFAPPLDGPLDIAVGMSWAQRNLERTMLHVTQVYPVPPLSRSLDLTILSSTQNGVAPGFVDNVKAVLEWRGSGPPIPFDTDLLDTDLLDGPGFEGPSVVDPGATRGGQPVTGWVVSDFNSIPSFSIGAYGDAFGIPASAAAELGGGNQFVRLGRGLRQRVELGPQAAAIDAGRVVAEIEAFLGGAAVANGSRGFVEIQFYEELGTQMAGAGLLLNGPTYFERNGEATLARRRGRVPVPPLARSAVVRVAAPGSFDQDVAVDEVTLRLLDSPPPETQPLGVNLLHNPGFETGPGRLATPLGWETVGGSPRAADIVDYPAAGVPATTQSAASGQQYLWRSSTSGAWAVQSFEVAGLAATIDAGNLGIELAGWFGGPGTATDAVVLQAHYFSVGGGPVASLVDPLRNYDETQPVTPADRGGVTDLVHRLQSFVVPPGTRSLEIRLTNLPVSGAHDGLVDNVSAVLQDLGISTLYPGTAEDLVLATGVNAAPSTGPGEDVKIAFAFDVVATVVSSPAATFDFAPLLLVAQAELTGGVPTGFLGLPGVVVDLASPQTIWLLDPFATSFFSPVVLPGGTPYSVGVPPGLGGYSVFFQAFTISLGAANGFYAATDAHEVRLQ